MIYHNENENDSEKLIKLFSLVAGNAGDKKNLHSSGRNFFFFFDRFSRDILFSSLVSFVFFLFLFVCCLFVPFWTQKCILWYTFVFAGEWEIKKFSPGRFPETSKITSFIGPMCSKQHLSNTWGSIYQEVKQHWGCCLYTFFLSVAYKKSAYFAF